MKLKKTSQYIHKNLSTASTKKIVTTMQQLLALLLLLTPLTLFPTAPTILPNLAKTAETETDITQLDLANLPFEHGYSIWGKLKYPNNFSHFHYTNPNAPQGGELVVSSLGYYDNFNPFILQGISVANISIIYNTLLAASDDDKFGLYGLIADGVYISPDKKLIIFRLNPRAYFSDGKPVTAKDVAFSFNTLVEKGQPIFRSYYQDIDKVSVLSPRLVAFHSKNPQNNELPLILGGLPILPEHFWQGKDFAKPSLEIPIGSGPYKIKNFAVGKYITYERVKNYWAKNLNSQKGIHNFDLIKIQYYQDPNVELEAFKSGLVDLRAENIARNWANAYNIPAVEKGYIIKKNFPHQRIAPLQAIQFNTRQPIFSGEDGRQLRRALQYMWDFEWANRNLMYHSYRRTNSIFANSDYAARGKPSSAELALLSPYKNQLPAEVFGNAYQAPSSDGSGNDQKNLKTAVNILKAAGWHYETTIGQKKRLVNKDGRPLEFEILLSNSVFIPNLQTLIKAVRRIGGKVSWRVVDESVLSRAMNNFSYDIIINVVVNGQSPGNELWNIWGSISANKIGSGNISGVTNPVIDHLIKKIVEAKSYEQLTVATRALDRVIMWNYYFIPMYYNDTDRVAYWNKITCPNIIPANGWSVDACWIDLKKQTALLSVQAKRSSNP